MNPIETTRMSTRGQVIIPKAIREAAKLEQDDLFAVSTTDKNTIVLKRFDRKAWAEDLRKLQASLDKQISQSDIDAAVKAVRRDRHKHTRRSSS